MPNGCAFHTRCQFVFERCRVERPMPVRSGDIEVACWLHGKGSRDGSMSANAMVAVEGLWCQFDVSRPWLNRIFNGAGR